MSLISLSFALLQTLLMINSSVEQCGQANEKQFFNGQLLLGDNEYPWIGILREEDESKILCITILITPRHVIMPAHCVTDHVHSITFANPLLGKGNNEVSYQLEEVAIHPDYALITDSDIAVGTLDRNVSDVQPICMPSKDEPQYFGYSLEMIGSAFERPHLRIKSQVHLGTPDFCSDLFQGNHRFASNDICGYLTKKFLAGSAVMAAHVSEGKPSSIKFYLIGIILYEVRLANRTDVTNLFLYVKHYRDWIMRNSIE
ncbi:uncharacterized protein LOC124460313 [Drosophila willistoni]|uniref:uncharacterized protein LOC124460313 n=1 Tax=Drosophila willistoni TaxID=7260 RepID=UPI001F077CAB|nr:uncharacterized protein LOC124460313 [Drosophila willistoni]